MGWCPRSSRSRRCWRRPVQCPPGRAGRSSGSGTACGRSPQSAPGELWLWSRNLRDVTATYPELAPLGEVVSRPVLLDGEIVSFDAEGRPDFGRLQSRMNVARPRPELVRSVPVAYYVFDVLRVDGDDLTDEPYERRRDILASLKLDSPPLVQVPEHYPDADGQRLLAIAGEHGLEGMVAKRLGSRYQPGRRSTDWIKTPLRHTQEVVIGGWTSGEGHRAGTIGALLLGVYDDTGLRYAAHVGTGFTDQALRDLQQQLEPLRRSDSPFDTPVPREHVPKAYWVKPDLVGEVEHRQWTSDQRIRHPSWRGLARTKTHARSAASDAIAPECRSPVAQSHCAEDPAQQPRDGRRSQPRRFWAARGGLRNQLPQVRQQHRTPGGRRLAGQLVAAPNPVPRRRHLRHRARRRRRHPRNVERRRPGPRGRRPAGL